MPPKEELLLAMFPSSRGNGTDVEILAPAGLTDLSGSCKFPTFCSDSYSGTVAPGVCPLAVGG
jgi:hypothetical protein